MLQSKGVPCVFEMIGGMTTHILDSLNQKSDIKVVCVHHEQAAAFAADAFGRMTGIPGIAIATSGPGATNLITGIGSCFFDSVPAIFLTGQVNRRELKGDKMIRQLGFQETDIVAVAGPLTKGSWLVNDPAQFPAMFEKAFAVSTSGRPGPVLLDLPMDVQKAEIDEPQLPMPVVAEVAVDDPRQEESLRAMLADLKKAQRPLILAGGGIRSSRTAEQLQDLVESLNVPLVCSLMGVDVVHYSHPLRVGMIGSYGNRWANLAITQSDFILVLGSRLDVRQTGADIPSFRGDRTIYHVDCEAGEINNRVGTCHAIVSELPSVFKSLKRMVTADDRSERPEWYAAIQALKLKHPDTQEFDQIEGINPNVFMHSLSQFAKKAVACVVDVGQHQMWAAQSFELQPGQRFLTSGGMGSMGYGLPAAIGAAFAKPGPVVCISGDGGFQCNIQELQTVSRNRLPLKMIVMNNECLGMVRQFQESLFEKRYQSTLWGYSAPDFAKVASAYGIPSETITQESEMTAALERLWLDPAAPALLQVMINSNTNALPKLSFGKPLQEMEPFRE